MATISSVAGYDSYDTFRNTISYLDLEDLFHLERVCKSWEKAVIDLRVLEDLFEAGNIPCVEGRRPNRKAYVVLKGMLERGVSVEKIRKYLGEPVFFGKMPRVDPEKYDLMMQPDPEDPTKKMFETYEAVVTPLAIKRTFGKVLVATMDEEDGLKIATVKFSDGSMEYKLTIPLSFRSLVALSKYPLAGQENGPVFDIIDEEALVRCKAQATKVGIYFMRSEILEESRGETWAQQVARAKRLNQEITPLIVRALAHSTKILESGQCPDGIDPWTYSRAPDCFRLDGSVCRVMLGYFASKSGVCIDAHKDNDDSDSSLIGVAPGVPAEFQPLKTIIKA